MSQNNNTFSSREQLKVEIALKNLSPRFRERESVWNLWLMYEYIMSHGDQTSKSELNRILKDNPLPPCPLVPAYTNENRIISLGSIDGDNYELLVQLRRHLVSGESRRVDDVISWLNNKGFIASKDLATFSDFETKGSRNEEFLPLEEFRI